ncbi:MAG: PKD domain-containing protein, partial [Gammaproteobacteria bacterium]|nr:PKD domain-containing protein [Gammaproteobacteria bacterium]
MNTVQFDAKISIRRYLLFSATFLLLLLLLAPRTSEASSLWLNSNSFGQNQSVYAELGQITSVGGCPSGGIDDFIYPWADVYIIQGHTPPGGGSISDVSNGEGTPNTLQYIIIDEVLGNTAPAGYLISGNYSVVIDDCQDGDFNGGDWWGAEFSVAIPSDIEPLSDTGSAFAAQLAATKSNAGDWRDYWIAAAAASRALFDAYSAQAVISAATSPADFLLFACTNINLDTGTVYCSVGDAWKGMRDLFNGVVTTLVNQAYYYKGISADPPDNNFTEIPVLSGGLVLDVSVMDSNLEAALRLGELTSQEAALAEALLHAMERYQGAELAGNGEYAFVQARQIEDYARALADAIPRTVSGFQALATSVESSGIDFVSIMDDYRATQTRVNTSGLTPEERLKLLAAGWTEQNIDDGVADYLSRDFSGLQTANEMSTLAAQMAADQASAVAALVDFADVMSTAQAGLSAQLRLPFPDADAGGPYVVDEGVSLALDASASSHPDLTNAQLSFTWDLDLDGEFDDASTETPSVVFNTERDGLIGLRVTAPTGYYDVAYAYVTVNNVNSAPTIDSTSPGADVVIPFDGAQAFNVSASDPDSDPITYAWDLDGTPVSATDSYTYNASLADAGEHMVTVTVSDSSSLSPDTVHFWRMTVTAPDTDGDGYPSNVDCDDSNAAVNPGATEVYYNGLDDDCNPATPDDPDMDSDGYDYTVDCDEGNASVNPGATEVCNFIDDNCDGSIDELFDTDGDGVTSCGGDCNDGDANVYPAATETCNLIDDNCDGVVDENFDVDGDGVSSCGGDCDDLDINNFPGNSEICDLQDNNCDASIDEGYDLDGDGFSQCAVPALDCDDTSASVYPGAPELCDLLDNNCDGSVDEGVNTDADGDGQSACGGDCDDSDPLNFSGNTEVCDNQDNNCDGGIDEGFDLDSDGFSICSLPVVDCDDANSQNFPGNTEICDLQDNNCDSGIDEGFDLDGDGYSVCASPVVDCDDSQVASFPGNPEICDGIDNNCDGTVDEGFDADGDGYSVCASPVADCDDANADIHPGHPEVFHNGINDDCDAGTLDDYASTFIIIPDDNGRLYYASSNGDGSWSNYHQITQLSGYIRGAAIADYDNDGDLDFIAGSPSGQTLSFYLFTNDGADNFTNMGVVGIGSNTNSYQMDMTAGDFNHDGSMDFLSNSNHRYIHQGMGDGHGNFTVTTIDLGIGNGRGLDVADFDHDGHLDYVRATYSSGQVILYRGDGVGGFTNSGVVGDPGTDPYGVTAADFNNDGHPDVIANYGSNGSAYFYAGNGDGTFVAGVSVASIDFNNHGAYDNYDFNRDGNQDLVASTSSSRKIYYYAGNGDGTFGSAVLINSTNTSGNIWGISAPPGPPAVGDPVPWITPNPYTGIKGDTVDLSGEFSTDDGSIVDYSWDFGDSSTGAGIDVSHTFPDVEDDFYVSLQVTDDEGKVAIGSGLVMLVGDPPVADAGGPYVFGEDFAEGGIYTVTLDGSNSIDDGVDPLKFDWDLGDSFSDDFSSGVIDTNAWDFSGATVTAEESVVSGAGSWGTRYLVTKRSFPRSSSEVTTFTGHVGTVNNPTVMWGLKNANDNYSYTQFPYAIYFNNNSWIYIYEDGASRGNKLTYTEGQDYETRIDVKPGNGATYYYRLAGSVNWVKIYDSSHSSASSYRLGATVNAGAIRLDNFDYQNTSTSETPTAVYSTQETFDISLTVTDIADQSDTNATTLRTMAGNPPVANPAGPYTPGEASANCGNYTVVFDGSDSTDDSGRIYRYDWDYGDGATGSGVSPSHTYAAGGPVPDNFTATLTVTDHALQLNTLTATATISPAPGDFPVASTGDYSVDESSANAGLWTVNFNGSLSTDDNGLCDYVWDFGDGTTGTGVSPSHQYSAAGDYTGTLTVRDHALQSHQVSFTVQVAANDPPVSDDGGPYEVDEGAAQNGQWTVNFDAGSSTDDIGIWKYSWDFGDGSTGTGVAPSHIYGADGTYTATLTVYDHAGQTTASSAVVTVNSNDPPVADAGSSHITERGFPVTLDASGSTDDFGIKSFSWDFGKDNNWVHSGATQVDGSTVKVVGTNNWSNRYLVSQDTFERIADESYTGRVGTSSTTNVMWGLKNDTDNYHHNQFPYAIYFNNNNWIYIYEDGASRGNKVTYTRGQAYDVRIDVKATGATYYYRLAGVSDWTLIYDSTHSSVSPFRVGATVYAGTINFSDFVTPGGAMPLDIDSGSTLAVVDTSYLDVGDYSPAVTVTDHALQTDTDSTTVTVLEGNPPVANAGGAYLTNEDIPTRFNGRSSTDDFGIKTYDWDFGDGESLASSNPWVDHRYLTAGTYTATLTVTDYAGHSDSDSVTVTVSPDPVTVAVPWAFSGGIEVPHDT